MEPWRIKLEYEMERLVEEKAKALRNLCPTCNTPLVENICPKCGQEVSHTTETFHDDGFEEYAEQVEQDWNKYEKGVKWEDVPD